VAASEAYTTSPATPEKLPCGTIIPRLNVLVAVKVLADAKSAAPDDEQIPLVALHISANAPPASLR
jgi:hypothetical protein